MNAPGREKKARNERSFRIEPEPVKTKIPVSGVKTVQMIASGGLSPSSAGTG